MADTVRIEKTSKKLKALQLLSVLLLALGGAGTFYFRGTGHALHAGIVGAAGLALLVMTRLLVWWNYG